jgi:hypothetical protein
MCICTHICICKGICICIGKCICIYIYIYVNAGMSDSLTSSQSSTRMKKLTLSEQVRYRPKPTQSSISLVQYRNKIMDAGMPMLVSSMPMPSYAHGPVLLGKLPLLTHLGCLNSCTFVWLIPEVGTISVIAL